MGRNVRWVVAGLATAAAFAVPVWLGGAVVLPSLLKDPAIRWSVASALGAVLGSLAVLWGHAFATRPQGTDSSGPSLQITGERAVGIGRENWAPVSTGDNTAPAQPISVPPAAGQPPVSSPAGTVSVSGDRAIGIGGTNSGLLSTGDQPSGTLP
jgi:hypothetical protein